MLSGCCGSTSLCSPPLVLPFADNQRKEPKEAFLVFILACVLCEGLIYGKRVLGKRKQSPEKRQKEERRVKENRCVWTCVSVCACLRLFEPVVSVYVHVSVSPREATPSQTDGKGSQTWDL